MRTLHKVTEPKMNIELFGKELSFLSAACSRKLNFQCGAAGREVAMML